MLDNLKREYNFAPLYKKLLYINVGIFVALAVTNGLYNFFSGADGYAWFFEKYLFAPAKLDNLLFRFWTPFTYMFTHIGPLHILSNMLIFYIGGRIYSEFLGEKKMLNTYILGGLAGFGLYVIAINFVPYLREHIELSTLHGASAAVTAVVVASAYYMPNYSVNLILLGPVKYKYIAGVLVLLSFIGIGEVNRGGEVSHIGGAAWGLAYAYHLRKGRDIGAWFDRLIERVQSMFKAKPTMRVEYSKRQTKAKTDSDFNARKIKDQEEVDAILDKISKSGPDSLTQKEKDILYKASQNKSK